MSISDWSSDVCSSDLSQLILENRACSIEFPRLGNHREHDIERPPGRCLQQGTGLHLEQSAAFQRQPQRAPTHGGVFIAIGSASWRKRGFSEVISWLVAAFFKKITYKITYHQPV